MSRAIRVPMVPNGRRLADTRSTLLDRFTFLRRACLKETRKEVEKGIDVTFLTSNGHLQPLGSFSELLKELRESRGLSQNQLGRRCGMSHATVSRLESSDRMPSRKMVCRLARAMSLDDIEFARLLAAAGFWPTVAANERQFLLATLSRMVEDRRLDEAMRNQVTQKVGEIVTWLDSQLSKGKARDRQDRS